MQPQTNRKGVFITIIILLIIFLPLSISSFLLHVMQEKSNQNIDSNPNHEFYHAGKLYFYDKEDQLLGTYPCQNEHCGLAKNALVDSKYSLDYYKPQKDIIEPIKDKYAFLIDNENKEEQKVLFYDIKNERVMTTYQAVKNYGIGIENDMYIVTDKNGKYGILSLENDPKITIAFDYDFIGIANFVNEDEQKIMNDLMATYKDGSWYLMDFNGAILTASITNEIVSYNGQNIIVKKGNEYQLVNYNNLNMLEEDTYSKLSFTGKYLNQLDKNNYFTVIDLNNRKKLMEPILIQSTDQIISKINLEVNIDIILNNQIIDTIKIS